MTPDFATLEALRAELAARANKVDRHGLWPDDQLRRCGAFGVYRWFLPHAWGGDEWSEPDVVRGYVLLASACLTTAFIITQRTGACQRIALSDNEQLKARLLPALAQGRSFATVGISHLTTSRRHLSRPVLRAEESAGGFVLDGYSPWVTGGRYAEHIVIGATLADGREILVALPTALSGVRVGPSAELVALTASHTAAVHCDRVHVEREWLLAGPSENVLALGQGAGTGGLQTSALAVGLAKAAVEYLEREAVAREELDGAAAGLRDAALEVEHDLLALAAGECVCTTEELRNRANRIALRATQAALTAAKGAGFMAGHSAGRWCREALFFLVWSCPQPVARAHLCEFAGLAE